MVRRRAASGAQPASRLNTWTSSTGTRGAVPASVRGAVDRGLEAWTADRRIGLAGGFEIDPDAADAGAVHPVKLIVGCPLVDDGDSPGPRAELPQRLERAGVVGAIDARLDDDHALRV